MSDEVKKLEQRIAQLEESFRLQNLVVPPEPDPNLAEDEWHAIFSNYKNLTIGTLTKTPWQGGSNMTSTFIVKRKV